MPAQIQITRIGRDGERFVGDTEEGKVHKAVPVRKPR
jgi:hypothetical protein